MATTPSAKTGANVRAEMARRSVTQERLAEALDLSQAAVSARLRGKTPFDINELHTIAEFLEVSLSALLPSDSKVGAA